MRYCTIALSFLTVAAMCSGVSAQSQAATSTTANQSTGDNSVFQPIVNAIQDVIKNGGDADNAARNAANNLTPFILFASSEEKDKVKANDTITLLSDLEQRRIDQQVGPGANQNGSTNLATRGSVPWLLGVAEEFGAVTQSTSGSTITFKINPINVIAALNSPNYQAAFTAGNSVALVDFLRNMSFGLSFNTGPQSSGVTSTSTMGLTNSNAFTGFNAHVDIYNKRDPRNPKWNADFQSVQSKYANPAGVNISDVDQVLRREAKADYSAWKTETREKVKAAVEAKASADDTLKMLQSQAQELQPIIAKAPDAQKAVDQAAGALIDFSAARNALIDKIMGSPIISAEYNFVNQGNQPIVNSGTNTTVTVPASIPNLSDIKVIIAAPLFIVSKGSNNYNYAQFTANLDATFFNSIPKGSTAGRVRDYQLSAQMDIPSGNLFNLGAATTTVSGLFLSLLQQPLGQAVQVNGVDINTKGNIGVIQAKLSIKIKNTGLQVPISFTYATRTELVKESDVWGNVGVTFNLDSLLSGSKGSNQ